MKQTNKRDSKISREFRLPANVMHEEAWEDDGPNMKLARAFIVVLILHIVAVAGLAAFNLLDDGEPKIGSGTQLPERNSKPVINDKASSSSSNSIAGTKNPAQGSPHRPVVMEGMTAVKVEKQMSTALFALQYGLTEEKLLEMNKHTPLVAGPLLPNETVYVPDSARKRSTIEDLPVAPVVDPPNEVAQTRTPNQPEGSPSTTIAQPHPPTTKVTTSREPPKQPARTTPPVKETRTTPPVTKITRKTERPPKSTPPATRPSGKTHKVRKGENLYRISLKYGVTLQALQKANGITDPSKVRADQVLKIPK